MGTFFLIYGKFLNSFGFKPIYTRSTRRERYLISSGSLRTCLGPPDELTQILMKTFNIKNEAGMEPAANRKLFVGMREVIY